MGDCLCGLLMTAYVLQAWEWVQRGAEEGGGRRVGKGGKGVDPCYSACNMFSCVVGYVEETSWLIQIGFL